MKTRMWLSLVGIALALVVAVAVVPSAWAQGPAGGNGMGQARSGMRGGGPGMGRRGGMGGQNGGMAGQMGGQQQSLVAVAADTLGLEQPALVAELQGGKTIAQVAAEQKVALEAIVSAFVPTRQARLAQAVAAGRLTQADADARLAAMRANVTARLSQPWAARGPGAGAGYADADGDGACDNAGGAQGGGRWSR